MTLSGPLALILGLAAISLAWAMVKLLLRVAMVRVAFTEIGRRALDKQPDDLGLTRVMEPRWRGPDAVEALARPLLALGFSDCGSYTASKMPGVTIRFLLQAAERVAAFVYEHPKVGVWLELSVRYEDGTTTALSSRPPTGIKSPPFFRLLRGEPGASVEDLYHRLLAERPAAGIKAVTPDTVVAEYELAYRRIMAWQKGRGLSPEEVAAVAKKWAQKRAAGG
jgi:hypothetical protein